MARLETVLQTLESIERASSRPPKRLSVTFSQPPMRILFNPDISKSDFPGGHVSLWSGLLI